MEEREFVIYLVHCSSSLLILSTLFFTLPFWVSYIIWTLPCELIAFSRNICILMIILPGTIRRRQWHPTPVLLPGKSHGRRSLVGCSPWGRYESDMSERLYFHFSLSCIGEGNGNPLQCSCLENPRDREAWLGCCLWGCTESDTTEVT